ncbi:hypothetical protein BaRGS_00021200, partial [Batillaria attramentaria]
RIQASRCAAHQGQRDTACQELAVDYLLLPRLMLTIGLRVSSGSLIVVQEG